MKIVFIGIVKTTSKTEAQILVSEFKLDNVNFLVKGNAKEIINFLATTVVARAGPGRQSIEEKGYVIHVYTAADGIAGVVIADKEYPVKPAHTLATKVLADFTAAYPPSQWKFLNGPPPAGKFQLSILKTYIDKYQDPRAADQLYDIQKNLDETKIIVRDNINAVLERGENLDGLMQTSDRLSSSAKVLASKAKKANSCCVIV